MWVDRHTVILGTGARANAEGAGQVEYELRRMGVTDILHVGIPYGHAHVDGLMNFVDKKKMVIFPWQVPYDVVKPLLNKGFEMIEITDIDEIKNNMAMNVVALEPGKVLMVAGSANTKKKIENAGIEVIEVDLSEIKKGWGAIHCMSVFLKRDPV
jgi:N-dimethylarginine dimethylaminohydrolase